MLRQDLSQFLAVWDAEAARSLAVLEALPEGQYDFRPDPGARSLGELAWHLAEGDGYLSHALVAGAFDPTVTLPELARPQAIRELAPAYRAAHARAVERVRSLSDAQLAASIPFVNGRPTPTNEILWTYLLFGQIHHRGQLSVLCRLAGGVSPGIYGPNREQMRAMREAAAAAS